MYYFNTINPADGKEWSIIDLVKYDEVVWNGISRRRLILMLRARALIVVVRIKSFTIQKDEGVVTR